MNYNKDNLLKTIEEYNKTIDLIKAHIKSNDFIVEKNDDGIYTLLPKSCLSFAWDFYHEKTEDVYYIEHSSNSYVYDKRIEKLNPYTIYEALLIDYLNKVM